jgi:hypothetical protein
MPELPEVENTAIFLRTQFMVGDSLRFTRLSPTLRFAIPEVPKQTPKTKLILIIY